MKLTKPVTFLVLAYCTLISGSPVSIPQTNSIATIETKHIEALISNLEQFKSELTLGKHDNSLTIRSDIPFLDTILTALNNSGLALLVIDFVLLRPELLDVTINTTIWVIRSRLINLTDLLIALQQSGLIIDVLKLSLADPEILPGLLRIGRELLNQSGINIFAKREEQSYIENVPTSLSLADLDKRENALLNALFVALRESGLALSIVQHLLTTPELAGPNAHLLVSILRSNALPLSDLIVALKESNLLYNLLQDILGNPDVLREFGTIIAEQIASGVIPRNLFDNA